MIFQDLILFHPFENTLNCITLLLDCNKSTDPKVHKSLFNITCGCYCGKWKFYTKDRTKDSKLFPFCIMIYRRGNLMKDPLQGQENGKQAEDNLGNWS